MGTPLLALGMSLGGEKLKRGEGATARALVVDLASSLPFTTTLQHHNSLYKLALPMSADQLLSFSASVISSTVVAGLGSSTLAALFLGRSLVNMTGLSPVLGSVSAVETFSGAAHGVAERSGAGGTGTTTNARAALGLVLQRALLAAAAISAVAALLWATVATPILTRLLGQPPGVSAGAAAFAARWAPALLLWGVSEACRRTAVVQGGVKACAAVSLVVCLSARPLTAGLVGLGRRQPSALIPSPLAGSAAADTAMAALSAAGMAATVALIDAGRAPVDRAWTGWHLKAVLADGPAWRAHARVALPASALVCLIWWAGQATVLLAGALPHPATSLAAAGVLLNVRAGSYMAADGLAGAAAVRVANDLGAGAPRAAALAAAAAAVSGLALGATLGVTAVACVATWAPALCPADGACVEVVASAAPMLALAMSAEAAGGALAGGLRGCGRQKTAAGIALVGGWAVGVPLQAWLALRGVPGGGSPAWLGPGVPGLVAGSALASAAQALALCVAIRRLDWEREASRAGASVWRARGGGHGSAAAAADG